MIQEELEKIKIPLQRVLPDWSPSLVFTDRETHETTFVRIEDILSLEEDYFGWELIVRHTKAKDPIIYLTNGTIYHLVSSI